MTATTLYSRLPRASILVLSALVLGASCQTAICQTLTHATSNGITAMGLKSGAVVDVEVVDTAQGSFSDAQVNAIETAMENIAAAPGSNVDSTTTNTDTMPNLSNGTPLNPISVVSIGTQAQINAMDGSCVGASGCTSYAYDGNGNTKSSSTILLQSQVNSPNLERFQEHEFSHADMGTNDCNGCANTIANPNITASSPTAPTNIDDSLIVGEQAGIIVDPPVQVCQASKASCGVGGNDNEGYNKCCSIDDCCAGTTCAVITPQYSQCMP